MNETYKIIQQIKQSIRDEIEDCGCPHPDLEPIAYGAIIGLKEALANIKAIEVMYCQEEEEYEDECPLG